jgi:hypothetical protein
MWENFLELRARTKNLTTKVGLGEANHVGDLRNDLAPTLRLAMELPISKLPPRLRIKPRKCL